MITFMESLVWLAFASQIVDNVENSVNDLRSVNALYSNGAPAPRLLMW